MLQKQKYEFFTTNEIEPTGWMKKQLLLQANSLSGNLDKVWPDIRDSKYIGGDKEGWERVPYWLDGFIPLAYLLKNDDMIKRGKKYIDAILNNQQEDGWICPCAMEERQNYDIWALFLLSKVLVVYYQCSCDERIEPALYKAFKNLDEFIDTRPLFDWGKYRWFEGLIAIFWLYEKTHENWLFDLAMKLSKQGTDYVELFKSSKIKIPKREWTYDTHVVNMAIALKCSALLSRITNNKIDHEFPEKMLETLMEYHGNAVGHFNGDECLSGNSPTQGTELCGVVEAMYSYELLFAITGNQEWIDRLETLAFNALPATISPDMWSHQYDQMVNQVACIMCKKLPIFYTNGIDSHLFGLEPNFGCCTANFNQGWPKFALSSFYKSDNGIFSASLFPAKVSTVIDGSNVSVELETEYPFRNNLNYTVDVSEDVAFDLEIRVPKWVSQIWIDGAWTQKTDLITISRIWSGKQKISIVFEYTTKFENRPENMTCLRYGALYYSVAIKEEWRKLEYTRDGVERKFPYCDYEIYPLSDWNYAFWGNNITIKENYKYDLPFSSENPPIQIIADMVLIDWSYDTEYENVCARLPLSLKPLSPVTKVTLNPYGCTNLRITEVPKLS